MKYIFFYILFLQAFSSQSQVIGSIVFSGIERTDTTFLLNRLQLKPGDTLLSDLWQEDLKTLRNTGLFNTVATDTQNWQGKIMLLYQVEESIARLPIVAFGSIKENTSITLGYTDLNALGRSIQYGLVYQWYDRHSWQAYWKQRFIGQTRFGITADVQRRATLEPIYTLQGPLMYETTRIIIEGLPAYNVNQFSFVQWGTAALWETFLSQPTGIYTNEALPDTLQTFKWLPKIIWTTDKRTYHLQDVSGWMIQSIAERVSATEVSEPFYKLFSEATWFQVYGKGNLATRMRLGISSNVETPFPAFVVDSYINIRGSGNRIARGSAEWVYNQEYRHTLYQNKWGALQGVLFSDLGIWRPAGSSLEKTLNEANLYWFTGAGGRIYIRPIYHLFLRADYGVNPLDTRERGWVLGIGQYF